MSAGSITVTAYLVIGADHRDDVDFLHAHLTDAGVGPSRSARFAWPESTSIGVESSHAPATPVIALVPPGPAVTRQTPMSPTTFAYDSAAIAAACSCSVQTYSMSRHWPERVVEVHRAAAGQHEDVLDAAVGEVAEDPVRQLHRHGFSAPSVSRLAKSTRRPSASRIGITCVRPGSSARSCRRRHARLAADELPRHRLADIVVEVDAADERMADVAVGDHSDDAAAAVEDEGDTHAVGVDDAERGEDRRVVHDGERAQVGPSAAIARPAAGRGSPSGSR